MSGDLTNSGGDVILSNGKAVKSSTTSSETAGLFGYDNDNTTYRNTFLVTNGNTIAATIGTGLETVAVDSTTWDVSTAGAFTGLTGIVNTGTLTQGEDVDINLDAADEEVTINNTAEYAGDGAQVHIENTDASIDGGNMYLLRLRYTDDGQANADYLIAEDNAGDDKFALSAGGATLWTLDAAAQVHIDKDATASTVADGDLFVESKTATANHRAINIDYELDDGSSGTHHGLYIDLDDDAAGGDEVWNGITIANSAGTNATARGITLATELDLGIASTVGAAAQFVTIDATSAINTGTSGIIDGTTILSEDTASFLNIDVESEADGAGEFVHGIFITMDDDADNADNEIHGITVTGDGTNGAGLQHAIVVLGANIDAGLQLDTGYLRVGTGATPDLSLGGADNAFIEGTLEVDGAVRLDGAVTGAGTGSLAGFLQTVTNDGEPHAITVAESGTVLTNAGSDGADAWTLPTAAAGLEYYLIVMAAQDMQVTPAAGDSIIGSGTDVGAGDTYSANAIGETLHLIAVDGTNWIIISETGTWTDSVP